MYFRNLKRYGEQIALIDCATGNKISYLQLERATDKLAQQLNDQKELVFIEMENSINSVIHYLACLKANKVIYLLGHLADLNVKQLIRQYQPNLIIAAGGKIQRYSETAHLLHHNVSLLLATSGTTGNAKFVKLSAANLDSNADSIAQYLSLNVNDIAFAHLKFHYSYGLSILNSHLLVGATIALSNKSIVDELFWQQLRDYGATSFAGVPYTFEALLKQGFDPKNYPSLRYITQAGGKLDPPIVKHYVQLTAKHGIDFFVMYGQTEAAPRIAYLPPPLAVRYPGAIGRAIPNGKLLLLDEQGEQILTLDTPGELAYQGSNIMMGYAQNLADLALDQTPDLLLTGDIACKTVDDLYYIVGRSKRFVKLFGLRINLDDLQSYVHRLYPSSAVAGDDQGICVAVERGQQLNKKKLLQALSRHYLLPEHSFEIKVFSKLPLLDNDKYDYKRIMIQQARRKIPLITSIVNRIVEILELNDRQWESINRLYSHVLQVDSLQSQVSFNMLACDSLAFVYLSTELEQCLGDALPKNWQQCSIAELENIYTVVRENY